MNNEILQRITRLQKALVDARIDSVFIYTEINRFYFTGLKTSNGMLLVEPGRTPIFYTDFRYMEVATRELEGTFEVRKFKTSDEQLAEFVTMGAQWKRIAYEPQLNVERYLTINNKFPHAEWVSIQTVIDQLRGVKSAAEVDALRCSAAANDQAFSELMQQVKPGMTELEILLAFKKIVIGHGWDLSFDPIFCVGTNAVECHHHPDHSVLRNESELLLDLGVTVGDYLSDMTRTVYYGKPTDHFNEIFDLVLDANQSVIAAIKPGLTCGEMDKIARDVINKPGYGKYFDHGLGHSVGLEIHENPSFSADSKIVMEPGMVITVEPGVYISGDVGVRIEDLICVTETGCEVLSHSEYRIVL